MEELLKHLPEGFIESLKTTLNDPAHTFYLAHQLLVSLALALVAMWIGQILAWIFWGPTKRRLKRLKAENAELRTQLK